MKVVHWIEKQYNRLFIEECDEVVLLFWRNLKSHAAIVAREFGIPAVVGFGNATQMLHDGDTVRVDGSAGEVTILESHTE